MRGKQADTSSWQACERTAVLIQSGTLGLGVREAMLNPLMAQVATHLGFPCWAPKEGSASMAAWPAV
eukprot:1896040-Amphidinium_carterae.1